MTRFLLEQLSLISIILIDRRQSEIHKKEYGLKHYKLFHYKYSYHNIRLFYV